MPTTRSSRPQPDAIWVIERVEVLEAKTVSSLQTGFRARNSACLVDKSSNTASMTRSQSASASKSVAGESLPSAASRASPVIRPRSTERAKNETVWDAARSSPSPSTSWQTVSNPARAETIAMPEPMVPAAPHTPTLRIPVIAWRSSGR